jgi:hypothetical protein
VFSKPRRGPKPASPGDSRECARTRENVRVHADIERARVTPLSCATTDPPFMVLQSGSGERDPKPTRGCFALPSRPSSSGLTRGAGSADPTTAAAAAVASSPSPPGRSGPESEGLWNPSQRRPSCCYVRKLTWKQGQMGSGTPRLPPDLRPQDPLPRGPDLQGSREDRPAPQLRPKTPNRKPVGRADREDPDLCGAALVKRRSAAWGSCRAALPRGAALPSHRPA